MSTLTEILSTDKIPAGEVSVFIKEIIQNTGVTEKTLAQAIGMSESQLHRMISKKTGSYRKHTLQPLERIAILVEEARKVLTTSGAKKWLKTPNPYLHDVAPILCLRSDKELEKVLSILASIKYGFPA
ncbi:MAG: antitoxin Xre/MbcA/ParS toxin-binding domain-containing protein [bacterium]